MKKLALLTLACCSIITSNSFADVNPNRVLRCQKGADSLAIPACGGPTCVATIKSDTSSAKYVVARTRQSDGAFIYKTSRGRKPGCTITLNTGNKGLKSVSCRTELRGARCNIS